MPTTAQTNPIADALQQFGSTIIGLRQQWAAATADTGNVAPAPAYTQTPPSVNWPIVGGVFAAVLVVVLLFRRG